MCIPRIMVAKDNIKGSLNISMNAYHDVVRKTIDTCYGIVGISTPRGVTFLSYLFPGLFAYEGIEISQGKNGLIVNVYVIVEYGTNIKVIAKNLCDQIRFQLKEFCNTDVENVYVHIKGIRKSGI